MDRHGGYIYDRAIRLDFSVNVNPFGMPDKMRQAAIDGVMQAEQYPDVAQRGLKAAIARIEGVAAAQVLCGSGAAELIYAAALAYVQTAAAAPQALLMTPSFSEYEAALQAAGCGLTFYPLTAADKFELKDLPGYLAAIAPDIGMVWICNPNNPTGTVLRRDQLEAILDHAKAQGAIVIVDECFIDFLDQPDQYTVVPLLQRYQNLVVLKAFTKLYAMPGLRLGYLLSDNADLLARISARMQPWNVSLPAQLAGTAAVEETQYRRESLAFTRAGRDYMKQQLGQYGIPIYGSRANYIFFKGGPDWKAGCLEQGILIRDCSNYRGLTNGYYRVAVRKREENQELLRVLEQLQDADRNGRMKWQNES